MISKKNKALAAGILAAAMSASAVMPAMASAAPTAEAAKSNGSYKEMFESLQYVNARPLGYVLNMCSNV